MDIAVIGKAILNLLHFQSLLKKPTIRRYSPRSYHQDRYSKDKTEALSDSDVSLEEEDVKLISSEEGVWNPSHAQADKIPRKNRRLKQAKTINADSLPDFKKKGRPKLLDLISSLSQSNVDVEVKENSEKIDNFFPYVPSEEITLTTDEEISKKDGELKDEPNPREENFEIPPSKKELKKKQSSISLELILKEDTVDPLLEESVIPILEEKVEDQILITNSSKEEQEVKSGEPEKIMTKEEVVENKEEKDEDKKREVLNESEPMFSKINIGDEPRKVASKPVNPSKRENKNVDYQDFRDDDKRVSSAGSSSSSSSGELYVSDILN